LNHGVQNGLIPSRVPPNGVNIPVPFVGVDANGQRGWFGSHWIPCGMPNAE
jgi:hypothetical protein